MKDKKMLIMAFICGMLFVSLFYMATQKPADLSELTSITQQLTGNAEQLNKLEIQQNRLESKLNEINYYDGVAEIFGGAE